MARYSLRIKKTAAKELEAIPAKTDRQRIIRRVESLRDNPRPKGAIKLSASERYRIRQVDYRILYSIDGKALIIYVIKIGHRKDVYKTQR